MKTEAMTEIEKMALEYADKLHGPNGKEPDPIARSIAYNGYLTGARAMAELAAKDYDAKGDFVTATHIRFLNTCRRRIEENE